MARDLVASREVAQVREPNGSGSKATMEEEDMRAVGGSGRRRAGDGGEELEFSLR